MPTAPATQDDLLAFQQQTEQHLSPLRQSSLLRGHTVSWSERTRTGVLNNTVLNTTLTIPEHGPPEIATTDDGRLSARPEKPVTVHSLGTDVHYLTGSLEGYVITRLKAPDGSNLNTFFHEKDALVLHLSTLVMGILTARRATMRPATPPPLCVRATHTDVNFTSGDRVDIMTTLNYSPGRDPDTLEYRLSQRNQRLQNWYHVHAFLLPLSLGADFRRALAHPAPVIPDALQTRTFQGGRDLLNDLINRRSPKIGVFITTPLSSTQGSVLSYHAASVKHHPAGRPTLDDLQAELRRSTNRMNDDAARPARANLTPTDQTVRLTDPTLGSSLALTLPGELCLLLLHFAAAWKDGADTVLEWFDERKGRQLKFLPISRKDVEVQITDQMAETRQDRLLDLNAALQALMPVARRYLQTTLARPS